MRLMAVLCEGCWNRLANELAEDEGATAPPCPDPDPEDFEWIEPQDGCRRCGMPVRRMLTNYDWYVDLARVDLPAKDVPRRYRWRVERTRPVTPRTTWAASR